METLSKELEIECEQDSCNINWINICSWYNLTESFIEKYQDKVDWHCVSKFQKLSESFIEKFQDRVEWYCIAKYQKLSEEFIEKFQDEVDWYYISEYQKLSEEFIEKFNDKVDWRSVSMYQKLSESFIEKFQDKINFYFLVIKQELSENFIENNKNKIDFGFISTYQKLSDEFIKKYNLTIPESSWMYKDKEWKRKYIQENTNYEIIDDKVIAYKSCRSDGYSKFNFQYHYSVGNTYESKADYNKNVSNSFGLSAWTKDKALEYCNEKLFKVEIDLDDIACIVHSGNKIRATKIKIVEEIKL